MSRFNFGSQEWQRSGKYYYCYQEIRMNWTREEVDAKLKQIMNDIHSSCVKYGKDANHIDYVKGAIPFDIATTNFGV